MKRIICVFCIFVMTLTFGLCTASAETYLKIGLKYGSKGVSECIIGSESGFYAYFGGERIFAADEGRLRIASEEGVMNIYGTKNTDEITKYFSAAAGESLEITPASGEIITIDSVPYRGSVILSIKDGVITVINCVELESYLKSVVPSEMPAGWNEEALKAQAVCARNYALSNMGKYKAYGFDMDDTVSNQVYKGVNSENPASSKAVEATAGVSLMYDGALVQTFFFSSGAGSTEDVSNVWGSNVPYLKSVNVPGEEVRTWEKSYTVSEMNSHLEAAGINVGSVKKIEITKRSETGRVTEVVITGENGTYMAKLEKARTIFGLNSAMYDIEIAGGKPEEPVINNYRVSVAGAVLGKYLFELLNPFGVSSDSVFVFKGKGNGHAVGMSQYGAKALAESGYGFEDILKHFYTGSYIVRN